MSRALYLLQATVEQKLDVTIALYRLLVGELVAFVFRVTDERSDGDSLYIEYNLVEREKIR